VRVTNNLTSQRNGYSRRFCSAILRPLAVLAPIALAALLLGACGSNGPAASGSAGSTGAAGSAANTSPGNSTSASVSEAEKFSQCMRTNGISAFPDPDSSGQLTIDGIANGTHIDPNTPAFRRALTACKSLEPAGFVGTQRTPSQQAAALKFAQCMRTNGIANFPDPTPTGPIINVNGAHSIPGFEAALQKCGAMYSSQMGLGGK